MLFFDSDSIKDPMRASVALRGTESDPFGKGYVAAYIAPLTGYVPEQDGKYEVVKNRGQLCRSVVYQAATQATQNVCGVMSYMAMRYFAMLGTEEVLFHPGFTWQPDAICVAGTARTLDQISRVHLVKEGDLAELTQFTAGTYPDRFVRTVAEFHPLRFFPEGDGKGTWQRNPQVWSSRLLGEGLAPDPADPEWTRNS